MRKQREGIVLRTQLRAKPSFTGEARANGKLVPNPPGALQPQRTIIARTEQW
jgi:hypothetical protein